MHGEECRQQTFSECFTLSCSSSLTQVCKDAVGWRKHVSLLPPVCSCHMIGQGLACGWEVTGDEIVEKMREKTLRVLSEDYLNKFIHGFQLDLLLLSTISFYKSL